MFRIIIDIENCLRKKPNNHDNGERTARLVISLHIQGIFYLTIIFNYLCTQNSTQNSSSSDNDKFTR